MAPEDATQEQKDPNSLTVTVDGVEHQLPKKKGLTIIQVCEELDIDIPRFCYHERLTIPANCRMCLVEVEKAPKLMPACHTEVRDGMVVNTQTEKVKQAQEAVLEFLLVDHPVDCPICDQAGECPLQDQYFKFDRKPSRIPDPAQKVKKGKGVRVGPRVTLDQERCVLCTRCVRFMDEVAREPQLGMFWRNDHSYISNFPGQPLTSNYSLNTVEICPVGALTSTDFRFHKRVWNLTSSPSICDGCARGCNDWVDQDGRHVYRMRARDNDAVNQAWMCDHGRLSYGFVNDDRVLAGRIGRGSPALLRGTERVAAEIAAKLKPVAGKGEGLAMLVSARCSTEDALMAAWLAKEVLGLDRLYVGGREDGEKDKILLRDDRNPNRLGVQLAAQAFGLEAAAFQGLLEAVDEGKVKMLYAIGTDVPVAQSLAAGVFASLEFLAVQAVSADENRRPGRLRAPRRHLHGGRGHLRELHGSPPALHPGLRGPGRGHGPLGLAGRGGPRARQGRRLRRPRRGLRRPGRQVRGPGQGEVGGDWRRGCRPRGRRRGRGPDRRGRNA